MNQPQYAGTDVVLSELACRDAIAHIASPQVHSGGGTAAAIAAALATASANLVVSLNRQRRSNQHRIDELDQLASTLTLYQGRMLDHADNDARLLSSLMDAYRTRKRDDDSRAQYADLLVDAAESGIHLMNDLNSFLDAIKDEAPATPRFLVSDIGAAAALALGCHRAARLTTLANIAELERADRAEEAQQAASRLADLDDAIEDIAQEIYSYVESMIAGSPPGERS